MPDQSWLYLRFSCVLASDCHLALWFGSSQWSRLYVFHCDVSKMSSRTKHIHVFVNRSCIKIKGEVSREYNWFKAPVVFIVFKAAPPLQFFFVCSSVVSMWCLFCHYLFLMSPSFMPWESCAS